MSALVPYNPYGYSNPNFFRAHRRKRDNYYGQYYMGHHLSIPRPFPTLPYYQTHPFQLDQYSLRNYKLLERFHMNANMANLRQAETQYQYVQYIRHLDELQKRRPRPEAAVPTGTLQTMGSGWYYTSGVWHQYEKETRYIPYPVFVGNNLGFNVSRNLPYEYRTTLGFGSIINNPLEAPNVNYNLPPKIRVIFIPTDPTPMQPSFTNALALPPFLFNRMAQPLCSLPLPPPLPNIASLSLTPAVQQMVAQQYANPVATLPFMPDWQMPQPNWQMPQPNWQIPQANWQIPQPNWQIPQPMGPAYPQYIQPQQQFSALSTAVQSSEYMPQSYIPPTLLPGDMPLLPSNAGYSPYSADASRPQLPWSNNAYTHTCRACIPPPPSLNIPVSGYHWMQHCTACHHVPADATNPNSRITNGRFTPLLRQPMVQQYTDRASMPLQQHQPPPQYYPYINTFASNRTSVHPLPPLPPGAKLISDEYLPMPHIPQTVQFSQTYAVNYPHVSKSVRKSMTYSSDSFADDKKRKQRSGRKKRKEIQTIIQPEQSRRTRRSNSVASSCSSTCSNSSRSSRASSCSLCQAMRAHETSKSAILTTDSQKNIVKKEVTATEKNVKLQYSFKPIDLSSVYTNNRLLKSTDADTASISSSSTLTSAFLNSRDYMENLHRTAFQTIPTKEVDLAVEEQNKLVPLSSPVVPTPSKPRRVVYIIHEYSSNSPSITSLISSIRSSKRKKKESDVESTTSTIKAFNETAENTETLDL